MSYIHTHIHTYTHTYIHKYTHTQIHYLVSGIWYLFFLTRCSPLLPSPALRSSEPSNNTSSTDSPNNSNNSNAPALFVPPEGLIFEVSG
jgi:hypothetical protein